MHHLIVEISDSATFPGPARADGYLQVWRDDTGKEFALGYAVSGVNYLAFPGIVIYSFRDNHEIVVASPELNTHSALIEDLFWRSALPLVLQMQGAGALHASAVLTPTGVVGFCAQAGSGKSTLAYGLSLRGYPIWTDDALVFDALEEPPMTISFPFKVRMRPDPIDYYQASHLGKQDASYWQRDYEQAPLELAPVRAIIVLQKESEMSATVSLDRIEGALALEAILKQAYAFSLSKLEQRRSVARQYMNLAAQVPIFTLQFSTGLSNLPLVFEQLERFLNKEMSLD